MNKKWLVTATIFLGLLISIPSFAGEGKGPVCSLNFDQGEGLVIKDASGNNNNGAILNEGKNTKWGEGKVGKALEFTAGDPAARSNNGCVAVAGMDKYNFTKGLTVEAWVKFNDKRKREETCEIISNTFSSRGKGFRFAVSWNMLFLGSGEGGNDGKTWGAFSNEAQNPIKNNVWYHVAGTYDGSLFKVYLNGEEVKTSAPGLTLTEGQKTVSVGSYSGGSAYGVNGIIDEVKIYDYARSALDILKDSRESSENSAIRLDGKLDEDLWQKAKKLAPFYIADQGTSIPAKEQTTAYFLPDNEGIYIGVECLESRIAELKTEQREKDGAVWGDDCVEIFLQRPQDTLSYYHFIVNASGSKYDAQNLKEATMESRPDWEGDWKAAVSKSNNAWYVEMYIPYSILGLEPAGNTWKINVAREHYAGGLTELSSICNGYFHEPTKFVEIKNADADLAPYFLTLNKFSLATGLLKGNAMSAVLDAEIINRSNADRSLKAVLDIVPAAGAGAVTKSSDIELKKGETKKIKLNCDISQGGQYEFKFYLLDKNTGKPYLAYIKKEDVKVFTPMELVLEKPGYRNTVLSSMKIAEITGNVKVATEDKDILKNLSIKITLVKAGDKNIIWSKKYEGLSAGKTAFSFKNNLIDYGDYLITGELFDNKNTQIGNVVCELRKVPPAKEEIWIENNTIMINGNQFFPIGFYAVGKEDIKVLSKIGVNFIWDSVSNYNDNAATFNFADEVAKYNMKMWFSAGHSLIGATGYPGKGNVVPGEKLPSILSDLSEEQLSEVERLTKEAIPALKEHPALLCWWFAEESFLKGEVIERVAKVYREADPYHPIGIAHNNGESAGNYKNGYEIFTIWAYPGFYRDRETENITEVTSRLNSVWRRGGEDKCVWIGPQTHNLGTWAARTDFSQREPDYAEMRNETYQGIVNNAKGMIYIFYKDPPFWTINSAPGPWYGLTQVIKELKMLTPVILSETVSDKVAVEKGEEKIQIITKKQGKDYYIFAVNTSPDNQPAEIVINDLKIQKLQVISENRNIKIKNNRFSDGFGKFGVHIYTTSKSKFDLINIKNIAAESNRIQKEFEDSRRSNLASWFLGTATEPRWGALIDNDEITYCAVDSCFRDIFKLPFPIEVIFKEPQDVGKVVIKAAGASEKDFEIYSYDTSLKEWKKTALPASGEIKRKDFSELTYIFETVKTPKIKIILSNKNTKIYEIEAYK
ncbi:MAG: hypothetical protein NTY10_04180 [Candidatus Omnitrophica bacterium]|nr:hypothetical protein [Candidatus Omnitrophota bacterium]